MSFLSPQREARTRMAHRRMRWACGPTIRHLPVEALSGGNQQKVVVGRWLATDASCSIAEDPTAGVDVGAKSEIYRLIGAALEAGLTVIVVSTDFEEVAHICHRALVFSRGASWRNSTRATPHHPVPHPRRIGLRGRLSHELHPVQCP